MNPPIQVVDLTDPTTLAYYSACNNTVIELDDTLSPIPPRAPRRLQGQQRLRATQPVESPIEILDSSIENDETNSRANSMRNSKVNQACTSTQEVTTRERSPFLSSIIDCAICLEKFEDQPLLSTTCGHVFCKNCLLQALQKEKKCPTCRKAVRGKQSYHPIFLNRG